MVKRNEELALLGLARRAGSVVVGTEESRRAIRRGVARIVVIAMDASEAQVAKVRASARGQNVPVVGLADRDALGRAVGKGRVSALVVTNPGIASALRTRLERVGTTG